jgi:hypothetical protein
MKTHIHVSMAIITILVLTSCGQQDTLSKMNKEIPIFEGAEVIESYMPEKKTGVIKMEIDMSKSSQKEIFDFYRDTMANKGWKSKKFKDYGKNGSIMEMVKDDTGTLSVMTIMKKAEKTGKIPLTLNLTVN